LTNSQLLRRTSLLTSHGHISVGSFVTLRCTIGLVLGMDMYYRVSNCSENHSNPGSGAGVEVHETSP